MFGTRPWAEIPAADFSSGGCQIEQAACFYQLGRRKREPSSGRQVHCFSLRIVLETPNYRSRA
jgi:hypothetical protein